MAPLAHTLMLAATTSDPWADEFLGFDANQRFVTVLVIIGCVTGAIITLVCVLLAAITSMHRQRHEANLKREMLDRGMSAEEVAKVVEASAPNDSTQQLSAIFGRKRC